MKEYIYKDERADVTAAIVPKNPQPHARPPPPAPTPSPPPPPPHTHTEVASLVSIVVN